MGLDIYFYRYDDFKKTQELEEKYRELTKDVWEGNDVDEKYDLLTQEQKDNYRAKEKEISTSLGLDISGTHEDGREKIEFNSKLYPEHMFKIGYFRSSYNEGGIQKILYNLGLMTIDEIFNHQNEYHFQPDWETSLKRVNETIDLFKLKGPYRVSKVTNNIFTQSTIKTSKEAMDVFLSELLKESEIFDKHPNYGRYNYSNSVGEFSVAEPRKVLAMIPGTTKLFNERECVYVITESDNTWYIQALEIVKETIEYILSLKNREQYYLHWSA